MGTILKDSRKFAGSPVPRPGLQTGAMTRVYGAGDDEFELSATAYDKRERPTLPVATVLGGGALAKSVHYNNAGLPVYDTARLAMPDGSVMALASSTVYDASVRLGHRNSINGNFIIIVHSDLSKEGRAQKTGIPYYLIKQTML